MLYFLGTNLWCLVLLIAIKICDSRIIGQGRKHNLERYYTENVLNIFNEVGGEPYGFEKFYDKKDSGSRRNVREAAEYFDDQNDKRNLVSSNSAGLHLFSWWKGLSDKKVKKKKNYLTEPQLINSGAGKQSSAVPTSTTNENSMTSSESEIIATNRKGSDIRSSPLLPTYIALFSGQNITASYFTNYTRTEETPKAPSTPDNADFVSVNLIQVLPQTDMTNGMIIPIYQLKAPSIEALSSTISTGIKTYRRNLMEEAISTGQGIPFNIFPNPLAQPNEYLKTNPKQFQSHKEGLPHGPLMSNSLNETEFSTLVENLIQPRFTNLQNNIVSELPIQINTNLHGAESNIEHLMNIPMANLELKNSSKNVETKSTITSVMKDILSLSHITSLTTNKDLNLKPVNLPSLHSEDTLSQLSSENVGLTIAPKRNENLEHSLTRNSSLRDHITHLQVDKNYGNTIFPKNNTTLTPLTLGNDSMKVYSSSGYDRVEQHDIGVNKINDNVSLSNLVNAASNFHNISSQLSGLNSQNIISIKESTPKLQLIDFSLKLESHQFPQDGRSKIKEDIQVNKMVTSEVSPLISKSQDEKINTVSTVLMPQDGSYLFYNPVTTVQYQNKLIDKMKTSGLIEKYESELKENANSVEIGDGKISSNAKKKLSDQINNDEKQNKIKLKSNDNIQDSLPSNNFINNAGDEKLSGSRDPLKFLNKMKIFRKKGSFSNEIADMPEKFRQESPIENKELNNASLIENKENAIGTDKGKVCNALNELRNNTKSDDLLNEGGNTTSLENNFFFKYNDSFLEEHSNKELNLVEMCKNVTCKEGNFLAACCGSKQICPPGKCKGEDLSYLIPIPEPKLTSTTVNPLNKKKKQNTKEYVRVARDNTMNDLVRFQLMHGLSAPDGKELMNALKEANFQVQKINREFHPEYINKISNTPPVQRQKLSQAVVMDPNKVLENLKSTIADSIIQTQLSNNVRDKFRTIRNYEQTGYIQEGDSILGKLRKVAEEEARRILELECKRKEEEEKFYLEKEKNMRELKEIQDLKQREFETSKLSDEQKTGINCVAMASEIDKLPQGSYSKLVEEIEKTDTGSDSRDVLFDRYSEMRNNISSYPLAIANPIDETLSENNFRGIDLSKNEVCILPEIKLQNLEQNNYGDTKRVRRSITTAKQKKHIQMEVIGKEKGDGQEMYIKSFNNPFSSLHDDLLDLQKYIVSSGGGDESEIAVQVNNKPDKKFINASLM